MRPFATAMVCAMLLIPASAAIAQPAPKDVAAVWDREARYWATRAAGDGAGYLELFDERFTGWPCGADTPQDKSSINIATMKLGDAPPLIGARAATGGPGLVVVYYRTASLAADSSGKRLVRNFTHTWVKRGDTWRIIGGMCREAQP